MGPSIEFSIVLESYNHSEGVGLEQLKASIQAAISAAGENGRGEVLLTDTHGSSEVRELLERDFPEVRRVDATGLDYDDAKVRAAQCAAGKYVVYLDGDCIPGPGWLRGLLTPLKSGRAAATAGFTRYEGGYIATILTIADFGFLLPRAERVLQCYASNNFAFPRTLMLEMPPPKGPMRCCCYAHSQLLLRNKHPIRMAPAATVTHKLPPFLRERFRRGYDTVAACWVDPDLPEARLLRWGPLAAPLFYARDVWLDWRRILQARRDVGLSPWQAVVALPFFPVIRLIDLAGITKALIERPN